MKYYDAVQEHIAHPALPGAMIMRLNFGGRWGLSIVRGIRHPKDIEVAVLRDGTLNYDSPFTDDVIVFGSEDELDLFLSKFKLWALLQRGK